MGMEIGKVVANRGVPRNKKPLQNILYWIEDAKPAEDGTKRYALYWAYERDYNKGGCRNLYWVTEDHFKKKLSPAQWAKFRNGERTFVIQRRVDGRNIRKKT